MKFGLMYEIQIPEPHYPGIEQERYKQVLAQAELADQVGFDYFWTVEHHFLNEFSHCSAPEVLYGAISQRTKRIRIGHAVALLPSQYNHPVRVTERVAVFTLPISRHRLPTKQPGESGPIFQEVTLWWSWDNP